MHARDLEAALCHSIVEFDPQLHWARGSDSPLENNGFQITYISMLGMNRWESINVLGKMALRGNPSIRFVSTNLEKLSISNCRS